MPKLLSGSVLRSGGSGEFIGLAGAQPQLPPTPTTSTGYTVITNELLQTRYASSLGNIEFDQARLYSTLDDPTIRITSSGTVVVSTSTTTGLLVIEGGVGIGSNLHVEDDVVINGIIFGRGYEGENSPNNISILGVAEPENNQFNEGKHSIVIGFDALGGIETAYKNIAIGRYAISSGTNIRNSIAIGDSALKNLGTIEEVLIGNISDIEIRPQVSISNILGTNPAVVYSTGHALFPGERIYITGINGYLIDDVSLNGQSYWVDYIDADSFYLYRDRNLTNGVDGTAATAYVNGGTVSVPITVEIADHRVSTGTQIEIYDVSGTTALNNELFWVEVINDSTLALYFNEILLRPVSGPEYFSYAGGGYATRVLLRNSNIAIGVDAAKNLIDGQQNFFFGHRIAENLTTGSNNFFIGHEVANNIISGNGNIAIGGDNLVDGLDNQVNIGSVFYFDGRGYATVNAETTIGLGSESTGTDNGALMVVGGAGILGNIHAGGSIFSNEGNPQENNLLYTPRVTVALTPPLDPRIGDFWIDTGSGVEYQYIDNNGNRIWVQFTSI
jgi:hypothetical protein